MENCPHPSHLPIVNLAQDIGIEPVDAAAGKVCIHNKYLFRDTSFLGFHWELLENGEPVGKGDLAVEPIAPGESTVVTAPIGEVGTKSGTELVLVISARLREATAWADAGYEVAYGQCIVREWDFGKVTKASDGADGKLQLTRNASGAVITGSAFTLNFDTTSGRITRYSHKGTLIMEDGPKFSFSRAVIDNYSSSREEQTLLMHMQPEVKNTEIREQDGEVIINTTKSFRMSIERRVVDKETRKRSMKTFTIILERLTKGASAS